MAIPTLITELSTTAAANSPAGSDSPSTLDDIQRAHAAFIAQLRDGKAASGANTDITSLGSLASINGGQLAGLRNLLINGNLAINQRVYVSGTATSGANQYTLDRWRVVTSGQSLTFTASGNGNSMTAPAGGVEQVIEGANIGGGTYVLGWTGTATASVNGTARTKGESFTLPANTNATVRLIGGTASLVQLEPGGTVTPFEHRFYSMELALCQRRCYRIQPGTTFSPIGVGRWSAANEAQIYVPFPVEMAATPSGPVVEAGVGQFFINTGGALVGASPTSITIDQAHRTGMTLRVGFTTGGQTVGQATTLYTNNQTTNSLRFEMEI